MGVVVSGLLTHNKGAAQNVNFAINIGVVTSFLDSHGVPYLTEASEHPLRNVELVERMQAMTVLILVER